MLERIRKSLTSNWNRLRLQRSVDGLALPAELLTLLAEGHWPRSAEQALKQNRQPVVSVESVNKIAEEETRMFLYAPRFITIDQAIRNGEVFWKGADAAADEISFRHSLLIGDFGIGSDAPIILDFRTDPPKVLRLKWSSPNKPNHWVEAAPTFRDFARKLDLENTNW